MDGEQYDDLGDTEVPVEDVIGMIVAFAGSGLIARDTAGPMLRDMTAELPDDVRRSAQELLAARLNLH